MGAIETICVGARGGENGSWLMVVCFWWVCDLLLLAAEVRVYQNLRYAIVIDYRGSLIRRECLGIWVQYLSDININNGKYISHRELTDGIRLKRI